MTPPRASAVQRFAIERASTGLAHVVFQTHRVLECPGADEIHDLRVSIRRFNHALRTFVPLLPAKRVRRVRKRLKRVMVLTSETRNRDIALELLDREHAAPRGLLRRRVVMERDACAAELIADLKKLVVRDFAARWRGKLGLEEAAIQ
jgi:CHAD domain-containing protein